MHPPDQPPPPGLPPKLGFAALFGAATLVCAVHGGALDQLNDADRLKELRQDRFNAQQKLRRREPLLPDDRKALDWRPGDAPPPSPPSWPWYSAAGGCALGAALLFLSWRVGRRRDAPVPAPAEPSSTTPKGG